jgi:hypothetical protein
MRSRVVIAISLATLAACGGSSTSDSPEVTAPAPTSPASASALPTTTGTTDEPTEQPADTTATTEAQDPATESDSVALPPSDFYDDYTLDDTDFGTRVTVSVNGATRTIQTNALPDHETGDFPNAGNPNAITAQNLTWEYPTSPIMAAAPSEPLVPGVAINGVKFEPGTAETTECTSGEVYRVEGLQDTFDLGMDFNNAHVQPTGEYHYHGFADLLLEKHPSGEDLVHLGFAADGHLIYHSISDRWASGYALSTEPRAGTDCTPSLRGAATIDLDGTMPDGTYTSDWVWSADNGDLDECNGITVNGEYIYLITDDYPFISRCLMGEYTERRVPPR